MSFISFVPKIEHDAMQPLACCYSIDVTFKLSSFVLSSVSAFLLRSCCSFALAIASGRD